jgi:hypothetical protein
MPPHATFEYMFFMRASFLVLLSYQSTRWEAGFHEITGS